MKILRAGLCVFGFSAFVLALAGNASAAQITFTSLAGNWHDATDNVAGVQTDDPKITNGVPISSINWGDGDPQSGYDFSRTIPGPQVLPPAPTPFFPLGTFTHRNFPVGDPSLTSVKLDVVANMTVDGVPTGPITFTFQFTHVETPNNLSPCPYPTPAGEGCTDRVTFVSGPAPVTFKVSGINYTLSMSFVDDAGQPVAQFFTREGRVNTASLAGQFTLPAVPSVLTTIRVSPQIANMLTNAQTQFSATAYDQFDNPMTLGTPFVWSHNNVPSNSIDSTGLYRSGNITGRDLVTATNQGLQGSATVIISSVTAPPPPPPNQPPVLTSIRVSPQGATVRTNLQVRFNATAFDQYGNPMTLGTPFVWSNANSPANSIDQTGLFQAGSNPGTDTVTATNQGIHGTANVTISVNPINPPPDPGNPGQPGQPGQPGDPGNNPDNPFPGAATDISKAYAYPVPWKSTMGQPVTFKLLAPNTHIRIFTGDGRLVKELFSPRGQDVAWMVDNMDGQRVASWVYFYILDNPTTHQTKKGKLVIIQ